MTTLIIGGTGFLGSAITERLDEESEDVVCVDVDPTFDGDEDEDEGVTVIGGDVTAYDDIDEAVERYAPDRIIHLAYVLTAESEANPTRAIEVNCLGTDTVFHVAATHGVDRVVYASSIAAYGRPEAYDDIVCEDSTVPAAFGQYPAYLYSATKQLNEYQARQYADNEDIDVVAIRPSVVFGPGRSGEIAQWASEFVSGPARGESVSIPLPPEQELSMVYRDDVADLFAEVALAERVAHDAYNTGGHVVTTRELAETVDHVVGSEVDFEPDGEPLRMVAHLSHRRAKEEFGYELTPLEEGIREHAEEARRRTGK